MRSHRRGDRGSASRSPASGAEIRTWMNGTGGNGGRGRGSKTRFDYDRDSEAFFNNHPFSTFVDRDFTADGYWRTASEYVDEVVRTIAVNFRPECIKLMGGTALGHLDGFHVEVLIIKDEPDPIQMMMDINSILAPRRMGADVLFLLPETYKEEHDVPGTLSNESVHEGVVVYAV